MAKSRKKGNRKAGGVKIKRFNMLVGMLAIVMVLSLTNVAYRDFIRKPTGESVTNRGTFATQSAMTPPAGTTGEGMANGSPDNNGITNFGGNGSDQPLEDIPVSGRIAIIDKDSPAAEVTDKYKTSVVEEEKNDCYKVVEGKVRLNSDALEAFNSMMEAYTEETGNRNFVVYGTDNTYTGNGSCCPESFPESKNGDCVDVAISSAWNGIIAFDGADTEKWIIDNCWKYGYILRYSGNNSAGHAFCPWHFRYVGELHAAIIHANGDMCLEDYVDYLTGYTVDNPLEFSTDDKSYKVYTVPAAEDGSSVSVPLKGKYDVYATNAGGYVIALEK